MLYLVFFILIIFFIAILFLNIDISIDYTRNEQEENKNVLAVSISLFRNLIKFKLKRSHIYKMKRSIRKRKYSESGISRIYHLFDVYRESMKFMDDYGDYVNSKIKIKNYTFNVEIGTGNAAISGFLYGVAWAVISIIESTVFENISVTSRDVKIKTNFDQKCFYLHFYCIFSVKIVHIIVVGFKALKWYSKKKYISKGGNVVG